LEPLGHPVGVLVFQILETSAEGWSHLWSLIASGCDSHNLLLNEGVKKIEERLGWAILYFPKKKILVPEVLAFRKKKKEQNGFFCETVVNVVEPTLFLFIVFPPQRPLRVHFLQLAILSIFHSDKDTHLRAINIYSPRKYAPPFLDSNCLVRAYPPLPPFFSLELSQIHLTHRTRV
jgi:hypothetical protein